MENQKKLQELQILEQNMQNIILQKQAFEMELSETQTALKELNSSSNDAYKIIGQMMLKVDRQKIKDELEDRERLISLRIKSFEKQESAFMEKISSLREEFLKSEGKK